MVAVPQFKSGAASTDISIDLLGACVGEGGFVYHILIYIYDRNSPGPDFSASNAQKYFFSGGYFDHKYLSHRVKQYIIFYL